MRTASSRCDDVQVVGNWNVSHTLARRIFISASANRLPMHVRRPYPNGSETNGWIFFPAVTGHWSDLSQRSGRNWPGAGKFSSMLLTTRCGNMTCVCGWRGNAVKLGQTQMITFISCLLLFSLTFLSVMVILYNRALNFSRSEIQHLGTLCIECWMFFPSFQQALQVIFINYINPEDVNLKACRNVGKSSIFDAAESRKRKLHMIYTVVQK